MEIKEINSKDDAIVALEELNGSTIVHAEYARAIATQFDVILGEYAGGLEPISQMDRLQPDNDDLGIGVGSLVVRICEPLGIETEERVAGGHGRTQRNYKEDNLPKLRETL